MDLLPSVGGSGVPVVPRLGTTAIAITNRTPARTYEWRSSDPKGYAAWFEERKRIRVVSAGDIVSERRAHVEAVPKHMARMPLQRVVQILKRHRDMMFRAEKEIAPISVILTTLAAHAYRGESSVGEAFLGVVTRLEEHVERPKGRVRISNPIRPEENFADRWEGDALKERAFERWLVEAKALGRRIDQRSDRELETELADMLGESAARDSVRRFEERLGGRESAVLVEHREAAARTSEPGSLPLSGRLPHQQRVPWSERAKPCRVKICGDVVGGQGARRGPIESRQTRILPQAKLRFEVDTDAPGGSQYYWQVVNTGSDAALANNLRGGFEAGDRTKSETALYRGMHSIECFVVHGGECVGRSGPFLVRVGS